MINQFLTNRKVYNFIDRDSLLEDSNVFTVIVGKNGTGKSTMISSIVRKLLGNKVKGVYRDSELGLVDHSEGKVDYDIPPTTIITISTSPFDKFPLNRGTREIEGYTYLGLRDLLSINFSLAYMSKIIQSLISSVLARPQQAHDIRYVLNYLGYNGDIRAYFQIGPHLDYFKNLIKNTSPEEIFAENRHFMSRRLNRKFFFKPEGETDYDKIHYLFFLIDKAIKYDTDEKYMLIINENGININHDSKFIDFNDILFLIQAGVLRLNDVKLEQSKTGSTFSIREASSGEQSVILSILGIASKIKDGCLICIDEPEICLHPEWQEKYIQILISTFSVYRGCHFLIATHSPQIISKLSPHNCFIMSMESGSIRNANNYINNSIDFQLASIFDSPGFKNEYLSRIALNIFSKVNKLKAFDEKDLANYNLLENQSQFMDDNDPLKDLLFAIKELYKLYA